VRHNARAASERQCEALVFHKLTLRYVALVYASSGRSATTSVADGSRSRTRKRKRRERDRPANSAASAFDSRIVDGAAADGRYQRAGYIVAALFAQAVASAPRYIRFAVTIFRQIREHW